MTDQITVPRETWDALREALEEIICAHPATSTMRQVDAITAARAALTTANAVSDMGNPITPSSQKTLAFALEGMELHDFNAPEYIISAELIRLNKALSGEVANAVSVEQFCYCNPDVSLQMVSGGGAPEGYLGRVTLRIGDQYRDYHTHPQATEPKAQGDELESEMLDAAISWSESNGIDVLEPEQLFSLVKSLYITVRDAGEAAKPVMSIPRSYGHLDANTLEQVAKEYPNEYFLKGSGVLKLITAIRELEQKASEPAWRPIETAPKDGTVVDLWHEEFGRYPDCYWGLPVHTCGEMSSLCDSDVHSMDEGWVDTFNEIQFPANQYTHWMPLPAAPEAKQ